MQEMTPSRRRRPACAAAAIASALLCVSVTHAQEERPDPPPEEEEQVQPEAPLEEAPEEAPEEGAAPPPEDFGDLDFPDMDGMDDELFLFEDIPVVVSAGRREQQQHMTSMPVSVFSSDDLHFSGLTNIAEALQFVPGVDFLQIDRNRIGVGVRGMHDFTSDRTLTLVDGRNATDPAFGNTLLMRLPLFIEDLERVEVARGPGGAAWGANAFNGVINLITKDPEDTQGLLFNAQINEFGDHFTQVRYGDTIGEWAYRISGGFESRESSDDAIDGDSFDSNDLARNTRLNAELSRRRPGERVRAGVSFGRFEEGDFETLLRREFDTGVSESARAFIRLERDLDGGDSAHVQWYANYLGADDPTLNKRTTFETDIEAQLNLVDRDGHDITLGGNMRGVHVDGIVRDPQDFRFDGDAFYDAWLGAFVLDRWQARERLIIEGQARIDYYTETGVDFSGRIAALFSLDDEDKHVLRLSAARAFRAPQRGLSHATFQSVPLPPPAPPDTFLNTLVRADDLDNEGTFIVEAGYSAVLDEQWTFRIDAYHQQYDDLIGAAILAQNGPATVFQLQNIDGAEAWGVETELTFTQDNLTAAVWYAYNEFELDRPGQNIRGHLPSENKVGARARVHLFDSLTLSANYRYSDAQNDEGQFVTGIPTNHRLDLTIAQALGQRGEIMVGVTDLFDDTDFAAPAVTSFAPHETPGRSFFLRMQLHF